jgi:hypothetical protein
LNMSEFLEDRAFEPPPALEEATHVVLSADDSALIADAANDPEPAAFGDFWVDNFLFVLPIALGVTLGVFAAVLAS